ncbi:hypothetical protein [Caballeronia sp. AZ10_KS36]|uniref:phage integrase central domain-containing protein n=1 Tax=Caballeronia sp. AZ10_KS36 TaxID=2921757 RepID=UPI0032EC1D29
MAEARKAAFEQNRLRFAGVDPADARRKARVATKTHLSLRLTFKEAAAQYFEAHAPGWRGARTAKDWTQTMRDYAEPVIGALVVGNVDTDHIVAIVEPLWLTKHKTANNVRSVCTGV